METLEQQRPQETEQNEALVAVFVDVGVTMVDQERHVLMQLELAVERSMTARSSAWVPFFAGIAKLIIIFIVAFFALSSLLWLAIDCIIQMGLLLLLIDRHIDFLVRCATVGCCGYFSCIESCCSGSYTDSTVAICRNSLLSDRQRFNLAASQDGIV